MTLCTVAGEEVRLLVPKLKLKLEELMGRSSNVMPSFDRSWSQMPPCITQNVVYFQSYIPDSSEDFVNIMQHI